MLMNTSRGGTASRIDLPLTPALILDRVSDVPDAHLERKRVSLVHASQFVHEHEHVPHGMPRHAVHVHESSAADLGELGDSTLLDSVEVTHGRPVPRVMPDRLAGRSTTARSENPAWQSPPGTGR